MKHKLLSKLETVDFMQVLARNQKSHEKDLNDLMISASASRFGKTPIYFIKQGVKANQQYYRSQQYYDSTNAKYSKQWIFGLSARWCTISYHQGYHQVLHISRS